jgi:hypothetical protein
VFLVYRFGGSAVSGSWISEKVEVWERGLANSGCVGNKREC